MDFADSGMHLKAVGEKLYIGSDFVTDDTHICGLGPTEVHQLVL